MQDQPITVAILISTYNWPQALSLVLAGIARQTRMPDEIVIADDGSRDDTKLLIEEFKRQHKLSVKHIWHEDKGFRKSLILNKAVQNIDSSYILEIDGDIIIDPHFVSDHLKAAQQGYFVQGSRAMITEEKAKEILDSGEINFSVFSSGLHSRFNALRFPLLSRIIMLFPSNPFHIKACNIAFWKSDYIKINGYDNRFEGWGGEDYEFAARLLHSGIKRKRLKLAALGYHIFHKDNSRNNTLPNDSIYRKTIAEKLSYTAQGFTEA
ncbi:Glycosyl transferase family 2 [Pedobacter westerhofensis]|uniref:Glycosyl transferase family 2 n=1 Tax=Pedobacter westerhofensis TaxID=425512 RepID=A0A521EJU5_9SPHI|nr:glycosyltransferase family 2 protein [Pedobacter westerhofensis]SMO83731.1 Glycosyl transferase family 2 [Pedobacter westerhofensis]